MVKFSGLGQAKPFQLKKARELISFGRGFRWHSSIINRLKETLIDDDKHLRIDIAYFISIHLSFISYHCEDNLVIEHCYPNQFNKQFNVHTDLDLDNLPNPKIMLYCHHVLTHYGTRSQSLFIPPIEDGPSRVKILGIDVVIPATPVSAATIQSAAPLP
ncbi:hypothetical protein Cgig2_023130 [Carnegiea gigantea]|uniref:Uncharacterized protein n=1 Tax=Carnegiea gigantea TaxID=171969 RepID=A0A9Q1JRP1_9CARY|nr:hypothetical protein Cgig2_023130 [Carnegiea gigantea]